LVAHPRLLLIIYGLTRQCFLFGDLFKSAFLTCFYWLLPHGLRTYRLMIVLTRYACPTEKKLARTKTLTFFKAPAFPLLTVMMVLGDTFLALASGHGEASLWVLSGIYPVAGLIRWRTELLHALDLDRRHRDVRAPAA